MTEANWPKHAAQSEATPATITMLPTYGETTGEVFGVPLMEYLQVLRQRKWTIASVLLLVLAAVGIGTLRQRPIYQAKAVLYIDRETPNIFTLHDLADYDPSDDTYFESAYKVLQSRTLARRVIDNLKLDQIEEFGGTPESARPKKSTD